MIHAEVGIIEEQPSINVGNLNGEPRYLGKTRRLRECAQLHHIGVHESKGTEITQVEHATEFDRNTETGEIETCPRRKRVQSIMTKSRHQSTRKSLTKNSMRDAWRTRDIRLCSGRSPQQPLTRVFSLLFKIEQNQKLHDSYQCCQISRRQHTQHTKRNPNEHTMTNPVNIISDLTGAHQMFFEFIKSVFFFLCFSYRNGFLH